MRVVRVGLRARLVLAVREALHGAGSQRRISRGRIRSPTGPVESGSGKPSSAPTSISLAFRKKPYSTSRKAAPTSIQWMSLHDADTQGIAAATLSPQQGSPFHRGPLRTPQRGARSRATDFVRSLSAHWSRPSTKPAITPGPVCRERRLPREAFAEAGGLDEQAPSLPERWSERLLHDLDWARSRRRAPKRRDLPREGGRQLELHDANTKGRISGPASYEYRVVAGGDAPRIVAETISTHEKPATVGQPSGEGAAGSPAVAKVSGSSFNSAALGGAVRRAGFRVPSGAPGAWYAAPFWG